MSFLKRDHRIVNRRVVDRGNKVRQSVTPNVKSSTAGPAMPSRTNRRHGTALMASGARPGSWSEWLAPVAATGQFFEGLHDLVHIRTDGLARDPE